MPLTVRVCAEKAKSSAFLSFFRTKSTLKISPEGLYFLCGKTFENETLSGLYLKGTIRTVRFTTSTCLGTAHLYRWAKIFPFIFFVVVWTRATSLLILETLGITTRIRMMSVCGIRSEHQCSEDRSCRDRASDQSVLMSDMTVFFDEEVTETLFRELDYVSLHEILSPSGY